MLGSQALDWAAFWNFQGEVAGGALRKASCGQHEPGTSGHGWGWGHGFWREVEGGSPWGLSWRPPPPRQGLGISFIRPEEAWGLTKTSGKWCWSGGGRGDQGQCQEPGLAEGERGVGRGVGGGELVPG